MATPLRPRIPAGSRFPAPTTAFSLLEVMIASGIFFMCIFAILAMVSSMLRNARSLRRVELDAGMVAARVCNTNMLYEGTDSGDFGNIYTDYSWETETYEVATNAFQVDIVVRRRGPQNRWISVSIWLYRPACRSPGLAARTSADEHTTLNPRPPSRWSK